MKTMHTFTDENGNPVATLKLKKIKITEKVLEVLKWFLLEDKKMETIKDRISVFIGEVDETYVAERKKLESVYDRALGIFNKKLYGNSKAVQLPVFILINLVNEYEYVKKFGIGGTNLGAWDLNQI